MTRHIKIYAYVTEVSGSRWWAELDTPNGDRLHAEMTMPMLPGTTVGCLFTIHRTKRGHTYLYWPEYRVTHNQWKRALKRARKRRLEWQSMFKDAS